MNPETHGYVPKEELEPNEAKNPEISAEDVDGIPDTIKLLSPYERARKVDAAYESPDTLHSLSTKELHDRIDEYSHMSELEEYNHLHLNFDTMDQMVAKFSEFALANEHEDLAEKLKSLTAKVQQSVSRYYKIVMSFDRTHINRHRMDREEYQEELGRLDRKRRTDHNVLIDDVLALTKLCYREIPEASGYKFSQAELFDPNLVANLRSDNDNLHKSAREKIANWAFLNERGIHISRTIKRAENILKEKEKTAPGK